MLNGIREIEAVFSQWASGVNDVCNFHIYNSKKKLQFQIRRVNTKTEIEAWTSYHFNNGCFVSKQSFVFWYFSCHTKCV